MDQVDTATHFDIPDLQAQVDDIQDNVNNELEDRQVATHQNDDDIEMMDGILDGSSFTTFPFTKLTSVLQR